MLNIGFIFPSCDYLYDPFKGDPHSHFQILSVLESHFGNKVNLSLIDLRGIKKEFAIYHIPECDIYLHSVYTLDYHEQIGVVRSLQERYPKAKHIAGGPHATVFQEECSKIFDSLIIGDGEESIVRAVNDFMDMKLKPVYKQPSPVDINAYSYPLRKYLPKATIARKGMMTLKHKEGYDKLLGTTAIFSRGCPYQCCFCAMPQLREYTSAMRYRLPKFIEEEIRYLQREYNMQGLNLLDEIGIPPNPQKAIAHLEAIGRTGIAWRGQCRVDGITPEIAKLARQSGCLALGLGVESVSQRSLDIINKKINYERTKETIRLLKSNDIEVRIYMIMGLPAEPTDIVEQTWAFIKETEPDMVILSLFTVRPGTEVFNNPGKFGIKHIDNDWGKTMHMFGRYGEEAPTLTFEYAENAPWGKSFSSKQIVDNYVELQTRLRESGLSALLSATKINGGK